ncbi:MOSC domain-containing protein [Rothia sp. P5766]|uniref:MOSC domain-containing protein n=1 Tax=Rothia sp. P5766 TaxID=3402656 RepID=UPI003AE803C9
MGTTVMTFSARPRVLSTNIAQPFTLVGRTPRQTGIGKVAVSSLDVFAPDPNYGDGSGVAGDFMGDSKHHGGAEKAVYLYAREELDYWGEQAGRSYPNGMFGENVTTEGVSWSEILVNQRFSVGSAVLEVSSPRQPCRTFADWLGRKGWVKTFTQHGDCGT